MPESFEPIGQVHNLKKQQKPNAWHPAIWAAICGASTITTAGTICDTSVTPNWFKAALILLTTSVALGSGYKSYKSAKQINNYIKNKQR